MPHASPLFSSPASRQSSRPGVAGLRRARWLVTGLLLVAPVLVAAKEITVGGSDLLAPLLAPTVKEFNRDNPSPLTLKLNGTLSAVADLQADRTAVAILAQKPGAAPLEAGLQQVPLAYATVYFAVPSGSAVKQLTLDQVASIFGSNAGTAEARRWADLGFTGAWSARGILPHALVAPRSLSLDLFRHTVLRTTELRSSLVTHAGWPQFAAQFSADEGAIALLSGAPPADAKMSLVSLAGAGQATAIAPTPESIHAGTYPLRLPFVLVFKSARRAEVFEALRFLLSEEIADALTAGELVAVPREARNAALFELETRK